MNKQDQLWLWLCAMVSLTMGFILVLNDNRAGWFLVILGISFIAFSLRTVQKWVSSNTRITNLGLTGVTVFAILLIVGTVAVIVL